jgi:hypothetical protein
MRFLSHYDLCETERGLGLSGNLPVTENASGTETIKAKTNMRVLPYFVKKLWFVTYKLKRKTNVTEHTLVEFLFYVCIPMVFHTLLSGMYRVRVLLLKVRNYLSGVLELVSLFKNTALLCEKNPPGSHHIG